MPVWLRLLALVAVPIAAMTVATGALASQRSHTAHLATDAQGEVQRFSGTTQLTFALGAEQVITEALLGARSKGSTDEQVSTLLGFDVIERIATARKTVDDVLAGLPANPSAAVVLAEVRTGVPTLRRAMDAGTVDLDAYHERILKLVHAVSNAADRDLAAISATSANLGNASDLQRDLNNLAAVVQLAREGQEQLVQLLHLTQSTESDPAAGQLALVEARGRYRAEAARLEGSLVGDPARIWEDINNSPAVQRFDAAVQREIASASVADAAAVASLASDSFVRSDLLYRLVNSSADRAMAQASLQRAVAAQRLRMTLTGLALVGLGLVVAALIIARSITKPLRQLADAAKRVSAGDLSEAPAALSGPREVTVVARALDEAVANLRKVEGQAKALALGALDDDALATAAPGALGESVYASVELLSQSLRDRDELEARLAHQATHDQLTQLPNRSAILTALEQAIARARRAGEVVALLFLDLDGFKRANDNHGHTVGDRVLQITAQRLSRVVRGGDVVGRLGGDEFVVIAERVNSPDEAVALGQRIIATLSEVIEVDDKVTRLGASVGVAFALDGHVSATDLLRDADLAVHRAKQAGKGRVEVFDERVRRELLERTEIEEALRQGLDNRELRLYYQPVVNTVSGQLHGFEALVRWERPGHGLVPPSEFIPVAETSDLIIELGRWVLGEATEQLMVWSADPALAHAHVAVNISGRHLLSNTVVGDVRDALERSGLEASRLVIEITETVVLSDVSMAAEHLRELRALGVRVALDDFGTGYTSIGQLWQLPVDILKVDRSFVVGIEREQDRSIVELMVEVAHTLGLGIVAEGVEDGDQLDTLRRLACDTVQGYLIARPLPPTDVWGWTSRTVPSAA